MQMAEDNKVCRSCRKSVDIQAKKCPYCQEDLRSWFRRHPILTFILIIFLFPTFTGLFTSSNYSGSSNKTPEPTKTPAEIEVEEQQKKVATEQAQANQKLALEGYMALIDTSGMNEFVSNVGVQGGDVTITVRNIWHYQPKQVRLQAAQVLWESWVEFCPKEEADLCRLTLEDLNGNKVGGSSWLAGSFIDVDD